MPDFCVTSFGMLAVHDGGVVSVSDSSSFRIG